MSILYTGKQIKDTMNLPVKTAHTETMKNAHRSIVSQYGTINDTTRYYHAGRGRWAAEGSEKSTSSKPNLSISQLKAPAKPTHHNNPIQKIKQVEPVVKHIKQDMYFDWRNGTKTTKPTEPLRFWLKITEKTYPTYTKYGSSTYYSGYRLNGKLQDILESVLMKSSGPSVPAASKPAFSMDGWKALRSPKALTPNKSKTAPGLKRSEVKHIPVKPSTRKMKIYSKDPSADIKYITVNGKRYPVSASNIWELSTDLSTKRDKDAVISRIKKARALEKKGQSKDAEKLWAEAIDVISKGINNNYFKLPKNAEGFAKFVSPAHMGYQTLNSRAKQITEKRKEFAKKNRPTQDIRTDIERDKRQINIETQNLKEHKDEVKKAKIGKNSNAIYKAEKGLKYTAKELNEWNAQLNKHQKELEAYTKKPHPNNPKAKALQ